MCGRSADGRGGRPGILLANCCYVVYSTVRSKGMVERLIAVEGALIDRDAPPFSTAIVLARRPDAGEARQVGRRDHPACWRPGSGTSSWVFNSALIGEPTPRLRGSEDRSP